MFFFFFFFFFFWGGGGGVGGVGGNPNFEKKNQQTTKHYKHDKLLIRQSVDNLYRKASHFVSFNDREVLKINVDVVQ